MGFKGQLEKYVDLKTRQRWYKTSECSALCYIWT